MKSSRLALWAAVPVILIASLQRGLAGCELLTGKSLGDRQLWVEVAGEWKPFEGVDALPEIGLLKVPFIYVVSRPVVGPNSTGAILIKSARRNVPGGIRGPDTVRLVRDRASAKAYCEVESNSDFFVRTNVSKKAYDEYHDRDYDADKTSGGPDFQRHIKNFHVGVKGAPGQCMHTDASEDFNHTWIPRNMRSQFSFDKDVVDGGMSAHYVTGFKIMAETVLPRSFAGGSDGFNGQRSEIKSYEIKDGFACVRFYASVARKDFVIRINDLGARIAGSWQTETRWEH